MLTNVISSTSVTVVDDCVKGSVREQVEEANQIKPGPG